MATLKASQLGLAQIKQARSNKGWAASDFRWIESASEILGSSWTKHGVLATGVSEGTWKRFLSGKYPINETAFRAYCQVLGLDWTQVVELEQADQNEVKPNQNLNQILPLIAPEINELAHIDLTDAPDVSIFYGRETELETVRDWVLREHCRLITVLGMGGIGKTSLSVKLARELATGSFPTVIWRSLRNAPPIENFLKELIQFLAKQPEINPTNNLEEQISRLLHYLRNSRCLLLFDNAESILQAGDRTGRYRAGYEGYSQLLRAISETHHQSCVILTSREKPQGLASFEGESLPVRSLQLSGLAEVDGRELFNVKGTFSATATEWQTLISRYAGNPLALKIVASSIHDYFNSDISYFLGTIQQSTFLFDDIRDLLAQQFQRLTNLECDIMYWLAIDREPITLSELQSNFIANISLQEFLESLNSLQRRSLIEKSSNRFTQQPVVMEYATTQLIETICNEINPSPVTQAGSTKLWVTHALLKATAKDYIRETQAYLIVQPIIDQLMMMFGSREAIADRLTQILTVLRGQSAQDTGYAAGNTINLLQQAGVHLTGLNCTELTVWQAYLQGILLHNVDFTGADISRCRFTETLGNILWATFSPDGQYLATCDTDCQVRIWEVQSGQLWLICHGHANWVRFVVFSPDGKILASCGADCCIKIWQVQDGVCIKTLTGHQHEVFAVAFSPDGKLLASASGDRTIKLWDVRDGNCLQTLSGHTDWVRAVAFSPDGQQLASAAADHTVKLWDVVQGNCLRTLAAHHGWVRAVAFSPDGEVLASAGSDRTIKLWDYETGECLRTYRGHQGNIYSIAFSASGTMLISGSGDCSVKFWDCYSDDCIKTLYSQTNEVCCVAVSSDEQTIACVSLDQTMRLWDYPSGQCLKTWYGHTDWALPVAFSPDGITLASGSNDQTIRLWDWQTGECSTTLTGHSDFIYAVAFTPNGSVLASGSTDLSVRLWQVESGKCYQILQGHSDWICAIAFHPHKDILASASADSTVKLWDIQTGQCLKTLTGHKEKLLGTAFSPDGQRLASCGVDTVIKVWDVESGHCLSTLQGHQSRIWGLAFSPQDDLLASCSTDTTIKLWDLATQKCIRTLNGHTNWVFAIAFSPDGAKLASAAHDHTVRLWNVATGECIQVYHGHTHLVSSIAFSSDGRTIASGSQDQTVRIWNIHTGQCDRILITKRLYEGLKLTNVKGLTPATISTLQTLGAVL